MLQPGDKFRMVTGGMECTVGEKVSEGKTKIIYAIVEDEKLVVMVAKNYITAHNDPAFTKSFPNKGMYSTITTIGMFKFLNQDESTPTAFVSEIIGDDTAFVAKRCTMLPIEAIVRRTAGPETSSYRKRHPNTPVGHVFVSVREEFFLKTTNGGLVIDGKVIVEGLNSEQDDPLIVFLDDPNSWHLLHPKRPLEGSESDLGRVIPALVDTRTMSRMGLMNTEAFLSVEQRFGELYGWTLIDWKLEFGITADGELVIADVIDNDSWRMLDEHGEELSKQRFRDGEAIGTVAENYARVAEVAHQLAI